MPRYRLVAALKLFLILAVFILTVSFFVYTYYYVVLGRPPRILSVEPVFTGKDVLILPYTTKSYAGYGRVFEPEIKLKVKKDSGGYTDITFLLDSGAVVSTLPVSYAKTLAKDIEQAQRIVLRGFGDKRTFGYMSTMDLVIKDQEYNIPVVFSEGELDKKILGRNGFFDLFTVIFDHKDRVVRLAQ